MHACSDFFIHFRKQFYDSPCNPRIGRTKETYCLRMKDDKITTKQKKKKKKKSTRLTSMTGLGLNVLWYLETMFVITPNTGLADADLIHCY